MLSRDCRINYKIEEKEQVLTAEDFRRCIKEYNPDGFTLDHDGLIARYSYGDYVHDVHLGDLTTNIIYKTFLQSVIEGINGSRNAKDWLLLAPTNSSYICVNNSDCNKAKTFYFDRDIHKVDKAKEQAIKYILRHTDAVK